MIQRGAEGKVGEGAVPILEGEGHLAVADERFAVELGASPELPEGNARAEQVVVLVLAVVLIPAQPARLGLELNPVAEVGVSVGADAWQDISSFIWLEVGGQAARVDGKGSLGGRFHRLRMAKDSRGAQDQKKDKCRSFHGGTCFKRTEWWGTMHISL